MIVAKTIPRLELLSEPLAGHQRAIAIGKKI
jgi:hypothetical protein